METVMIYKNGIERIVKAERVQEYLEKGYVLAEKPKPKTRAKKV